MNRSLLDSDGLYRCESNYEVTSYVAEFWNTISNLALILPPLAGILNARRASLYKRDLSSFFFFLLVGVGSAAFHASLKWETVMGLVFSAVFLWCDGMIIITLYFGSRK